MNAGYKRKAQPSQRESSLNRGDFEWACIREFSHSGVHIGANVAPAERRARIRAAKLREHKSDLTWRDSGLTYAEVFRRAYHEALGEYEVQEDYPMPAYAAFSPLRSHPLDEEKHDLDEEDTSA